MRLKCAVEKHLLENVRRYPLFRGECCRLFVARPRLPADLSEARMRDFCGFYLLQRFSGIQVHQDDQGLHLYQNLCCFSLGCSTDSQHPRSSSEADTSQSSESYAEAESWLSSLEILWYTSSSG